MINFNNVVEICTYLKKPKIDYQRNHIEARCPFCGDSITKKNARRFYIDYYKKYDSYVYKCFRCGEKGDIISLFSHFENKPYFQIKKRLHNYLYDPIILKKTLLSSQQNQTKIIEMDTNNQNMLDLNLNDCVSFNSTPKVYSIIENQAIKYLYKFKIERKLPDDINIKFAIRGKYKSRIIIPIYVNNVLVYFQARSIFDHMKPKYLNPTCEKTNIILNSDKFDRNKSIIITEGIIDAYMVENNQSTCIIGGSLTNKYLNTIKSYTDKNIIVALDNPYKDNNAYKVLKTFIKNNINNINENIRFFIPPKEYNFKDLNEYVIKYGEYNSSSVYNFVVENSHNILKTKMKLL